jgi:SAM-dependent methyltransferase
MDSTRLRAKKAELITRHGVWTSENIRLNEHEYTIAPGIVGNEVRVKRVLRVLSDLLPKPLKDLRVLDLGSLEGAFAVELAKQGAEVIAIEGRQANAEKIKFAKEVLELERLTVLTDDVRNVNAARLGIFDAILNMGVLYHLPEHDLFEWMQRLGEMCRHLMFVNTHFSLRPERKVLWREEEYCGKDFQEHAPEEDATEREKKLWASLDNPTSFWLTRPSLYNLLQAIGFTSVYEVQNPATWEAADRVTLVGIKGRPMELLTTPPELNGSIEKWPEQFDAMAPAPRKMHLILRMAKLLPLISAKCARKRS